MFCRILPNILHLMPHILPKQVLELQQSRRKNQHMLENHNHIIDKYLVVYHRWKMYRYLEKPGYNTIDNFLHLQVSLFGMAGLQRKNLMWYLDNMHVLAWQDIHPIEKIVNICFSILLLTDKYSNFLHKSYNVWYHLDIQKRLRGVIFLLHWWLNLH